MEQTADSIGLLERADHASGLEQNSGGRSEVKHLRYAPSQRISGKQAARFVNVMGGSVERAAQSLGIREKTLRDILLQAEEAPSGWMDGA